MRFAQPHFFWVMLLALFALTAFFYWTWRVKQKLISQFVQSRLLANLTVGVSHSRQIFRLVLLIVSVAFIFLALARPKWGFVLEEAKQQGLDIVVAIDTSRSMLAEDVSPNRLTRAKLAALDLARVAKTDRLGVIPFAGTAFLQAPLTLDEQAFRQSIEALDVGIIPQGGTALSEAINTALTAFEKGNDNYKVMVLFTDGEDHDTDTETMEAAKAAAKAGMKIFTIGVGTPEGELLRVKNDQGQMDFVKDENGDVVKSHLNENLLRQIATVTGGAYLPLRGANPMDVLYQQALAPLPKSDNKTFTNRVYHERYHWPLGLAIIVLIAELFLPERRRVHRAPTAKPTVSEPAAAVAVLICLLVIPLAATASPSSAFNEYNRGKFDDAFKEYDRLSEQKTNDYRLHYNAGTAAYRAKDFKSAVDHFGQALNTPEIISNPKAQQQTFYNLGNTLYEMGVPMSDAQKQKEMWEHSIESYDHALQLDPKDPDAKNNMEFVKKRLEQLKQQQQQQKQQQGKNDKNKDDQKNQQDKQQQQQDQQAKQNQKDDKGKDQKDQQAKQDQQKQDQSQQAKQDDQKKDQKQQQQQAQGKKNDKKDKENAQAAGDDKRDKAPEQSDDAQAYYGKMSPQQARQILDADRDEEKALVFSPENKPNKQANRKLKDW